MATEEVGIRLSLKERRQVAKGLSDTEGELEDVAGAARDVDTTGRQAASSLEKASSSRIARGFAGIGRGARGLFGFLGRGAVAATRGAVVGITALGVAAGITGLKAIGLAGDARETASAFDTVFGPAARGVQKDLDGLTNRFGLYNPELQDAARQFGVFAKAAKLPRKDLASFSTDLTKAGLDLSSFYNVNPGEAFQALQSGLSGEAEPLRRFGIFLSDATMKAEAASMGLTGELTEQQKVMIRQRIIMKSLGDAQGDLARTSGGFANQQRAAAGQAKTFLSLLGGPLTTAATGAFRGLNAILGRATKLLRRELPGLEKDAEGASKLMERWGRRIARGLPDALDRVRGGVRGLRGDWKRFKGSASGDELGTLKTNVAALAPALSAAKDELPGITDAMSVANVVTGFLADHVDTLAGWMPVLATGFVAYKVAQLAANVAAAASVPLKVLDIIATRQLTTEMGRLVIAQGGTVGTSVAASAAIGTQAGATTGATVAQRGLNAALRANPIGAVITAAMLLVGGFVLLYQNSDTFRGIIDGLWNNVLKPFGKWIGGVLLTYLKTLAKMWLTMGRFGVMAFRLLLTAAFNTFDGILGAAEAGLGWIPGIGDKIKGARAAFNEFGDSTIAKLKRVEDKLRDTQTAIDGVARNRSATINITTAYTTLGSPTRGRGDDFMGGGATTTPRGRVTPRTTSFQDLPGPGVEMPPLERGGVGGGGGGGSQTTVIPVNVDGKEMTRITLKHVGDAVALQ